jgi:hypothetical protein
MDFIRVHSFRVFYAAIDAETNPGREQLGCIRIFALFRIISVFSLGIRHWHGIHIDFP